MQQVATVNSLQEDIRVIRVVHLIGQLDPGGIETWLLHLLQHWEKEYVNGEPLQIRSAIIVQKKTNSLFEKRFEKLNIQIIECPINRNSAFGLYSYMKRLYKILIDFGPFDIIHSHLQYFSAFTTLTALIAGIKSRIVHSHTISHTHFSYKGFFKQLKRKSYEKINSLCINLAATQKFSVSVESGISLFGGSCGTNFDVHCWGFDFSRYDPCLTEQLDIRKELNIPPSAPCIVHVGRFAPEKNHEFLIKTFHAFIQKYSFAFPGSEHPHLLLIGKGKLIHNIKELIKTLQLEKYVHLLGTRDDVPAILKQMNLFLLPSFSEGLPIVATEAQAAGIPVVMSDYVTDEAVISNELVTKLPINNCEIWTDAIISNITFTKLHNPKFYQLVKNSRFSIIQESAILLLMYSNFAKR